MKRYCWLLFLFLAFPACETEDECSVDADCDDSDSCTEDRCRLGLCSRLNVPGCCHTDADCGPSFGLRCNPDSDQCVECLSDADCEGDTKCTQDHKCLPNLGILCTGNDECGSNWCLTEAESGYPGGFCGIECRGPEDCESFACVGVAGGKMTCLPVCMGDQDCRPEYMCLPTAPDRGACFPHCTNDADCSAVGACNPWLGLCMGAAPGGDNGAACQTDADCKGFCAREADTGAPGGVCISICSPSKIACPAEDACVWQLSPYLGEANICLPTFNPQTGCRPEYAPQLAIQYLAGTEPQPVGVCQPACRNDADCAMGTCNIYSGLCSDPVQGAEHGAACVTHEECKGHCLFFWPEGYCTGPCRPAAPDCPGNGVCINLGFLALCTESCQSDTDCRDGYVCDQNALACLPPPEQP